ncbi:HXXEE domain-containing protein [Ureibacillus sp. GCM10028918]|uniref:HXXEE domain-containing protein n=1 Tax=Ureibacillus sp. GCM10028918 TaxID=3273429 RepID=UPI0036118764
MGGWFEVQTLIWLFPIIFMFHDFEEIIFAEKWIQKNSSLLYKKLPKKVAAGIINQLSMSTAQFSVAVLIIFLFVSSSTIMANQYLHEKPFGSIAFFAVVTLTFFLHAFMHIGQSIFLRTYTPGSFTSVILLIPYSLLLYGTLLKYDIITWKLIFICLPFILLLVPVLLIAHSIGKKIIR